MSEAEAVGYLNNICTGANPGGMEHRIIRDDNGNESGGRTYWIAGNGIADLSTKAAADHCGHRFLPLGYSSQATMDVSPSTRPRVTADLFQFVK